MIGGRDINKANKVSLKRGDSVEFKTAKPKETVRGLKQTQGPYDIVYHVANYLNENLQRGVEVDDLNITKEDEF